jgi:catalase
MQNQDSTQAGGSGCRCSSDPIGELERLFVRATQRPRMLAGQHPVRRAVFLKQHGCAHGTFDVLPDLPHELRVGVFEHEAFPAWVRFSSDTLPGLADFETTIGVGIKLFGVPGEKLLEADALTQDFVLQNFDIFFVDNATEMCEFTCAGVQNHNYDLYLDDHPKTRQILADMARPVPSLLHSEYWSVLPSAFGADRHVKYKLAPVSAGEPAQPPTEPNPNYLADDLRRRLLAGEARFRFSVQLRADPDRMPLDEATVRWDEELSPPIQVATLVLPSQDIDAPGQPEYGENLSFTPWHSLAAHAPVGSLHDARKLVYQASAQLRRTANGIPIVEPRQPRLP